MYFTSQYVLLDTKYLSVVANVARTLGSIGWGGGGGGGGGGGKLR